MAYGIPLNEWTVVPSLVVLDVPMKVVWRVLWWIFGTAILTIVSHYHCQQFLYLFLPSQSLVINPGCFQYRVRGAIAGTPDGVCGFVCLELLLSLIILNLTKNQIMKTSNA